MADRPRSEDQLTRILQLLPLATRADGVRMEDLARRLGVAESEIVRDLGEVIGRSYYRPAGDFDDVAVMIEAGRVEVWTSGQFRRPPRLTQRESMALGLGLRMLAAGASDPRPGRSYRALASLLESRLERCNDGRTGFGIVLAGGGYVQPRPVLIATRLDIDH